MTLGCPPRGRSMAAVSPDSAPVVTPTPATEIVYPDTDGKPLAEGTAQYNALTGTVVKLKGRYSDRPDVAVIGSMLVYYEEGNVHASVAPDVFVIFGVEDRPRPYYLLWTEGKAPDFVLEVTADSTWQEDAGHKRDIYARLGVTEYWRFDPTPDSHILQPPLIGERWVAGAYQPIQVQAHGDREWRGYSDLLGLEFRTDGGRLELFDPETRTMLLDYLGYTALFHLTQARLHLAQAKVHLFEGDRDLAEAETRSAQEQAQWAEMCISTRE